MVSNKKQKKILITGGLGFIGSSLAKKNIALGNNVTLISRSDKKIKNIQGLEDKVHLKLMDIRDLGQEVADKDIIFHCASTVDNYNIHDKPYIDVEVNCKGTIALLEACRHHNSNARIVYTSTFFVNGNLKELPATPDSPCNPLGIYPATKLAAEHFCKVYNNVFDMNSVIARFANVFGPFEQRTNKKKAGFNYLINQILIGNEINLYSGGNFLRDFIYIDDAVDACVTIAEKGEKGEIYYIGSGNPILFKDLINIVIEEAGGGKTKSIDPPGFHKRVGMTDYYCDNSNLKQLGWSSTVSIRQGIQNTIKHYLGYDKK